MFVYSRQHFIATNLQNLSAHLSTPHSTRAPEHDSSCGPPSSSALNIWQALWQGGQGQIGGPLRLLTFGGGKKIWAVKKKVRRMLRDAASAHYVNACAPKQKQWKQ